MTTMTAARSSATGAPGYSEILPCRPESARRARLLVSTALQTWGFSACADLGTLIVSELIANVVTHTRCRLARVTITRIEDGAVRIAVADTSRSVPTVASPAGDAGSGRGLLLVDALSDRWGYRLHRSSKAVWAELSIKADEAEK
ncbi:ATP-binding protein [Streptomyces anulatus]|uniref:ATP-binding protein n=1 Tax=Streptomyces anulatus TaxID=1892 RepID=UPI00224E14C4|nr:ATP-binding protein [Streptomyces anulatus]MCX4520321.1 ATP-binding protein [Streptomyces anulatus]WSI79536.1 ATP-binding protein [Streptomyces anulatus]WSU75478.1 ATP-binding protein [Streptomyces anulatus]WTD11856.1 ATP-binding protein [Streptomyces anulatus]WTE05165.1 ATP-binding protein [Streptomyces anulatus]